MEGKARSGETIDIVDHQDVYKRQGYRRRVSRFLAVAVHHVQRHADQGHDDRYL